MAIIDKKKIVDEEVNKVYKKRTPLNADEQFRQSQGISPVNQGLRFAGTDASTAVMSQKTGIQPNVATLTGSTEFGPNRQDPVMGFLKSEWQRANMTPQDRLAIQRQALPIPAPVTAKPTVRPTGIAEAALPPTGLKMPVSPTLPQGNNGMSVGIPGMPWLQQPQTQAKAAAVPVEMTAAPGQAATVPTGITNYEGRPVDPYAGPSAIPEIGTYKGADGNPVYTNIATGPDGNEGIATANRNANIEALDSHNRYLATRDAADAITRAYNQPTKQNIIAGALAQKVLQYMGINEVEYKKLFSQRGIDDATIQNLLSQSDQNKARTALAIKQAGVLPGSFAEKQMADVDIAKASHPEKASPDLHHKTYLDLYGKFIAAGMEPDEAGIKAQAAADNYTGPGNSGNAVAQQPKAGDVKGGYRFKGGDPSQQANWEKA